MMKQVKYFGSPATLGRHDQVLLGAARGVRHAPAFGRYARGLTFTERDILRMHAEAALIREYTLEELTAHGAYRPRDGIQFV